MRPEEYVQRVDQVAASPEAQYTPSTAVQEAGAQLSEVAAGKPSPYQLQDADRLGGLFDQIMQRGQFQYDPTQDQPTQQYIGAYQQAGQQAAADTKRYTDMLSGGWGNTYSGAAANQQYGEYLRGMWDNMPALQANAQNAYNAETDRLGQLYNLAAQRDDIAYGRYRDSVNDWKADRQYAAQRADMLYGRDYQQWSDRMNLAATTTGWGHEDRLQDRKQAYDWALQLIQQGILPNPDILAMAEITEADAIELAKKFGYDDGTGGGGGGGRGRRPGGSGGSASATATAGPAAGQGFLSWFSSTQRGGK